MTHPSLTAIRIVLVEPAGPLNVGSVARVMKNMGLRYLTLVNPQCDPLAAEARQMAVHGADVLAAAVVVPEMTQALAGCRRAIATSGRSRIPATHLEHPRAVLPWLLEARQENSAALIFGPEDRGLSNAELNHAQRFLAIPTSPVYPSLNLAQAVGICCYELAQLSQGTPFQPAISLSWSQPSIDRDNPHHRHLLPCGIGDLAVPTGETRSVNPPPQATDETDPATLESVAAFYAHLELVLLKIGYLYPHTASSRMKKFRRLCSRALPSANEVALLQGILSQVEWAIQAASDPSNPGNSPAPDP